MINSISSLDSCKNILKTPILLSILIISFLVVIILTGYSRFYTMPIFSHLLVSNIEEEAKRTADYLSAVLLTDQLYSDLYKHVKPKNPQFFVHSVNLNEEMFSQDLIDKIHKAMFFLKLEKLKIFDDNGKIVYSSDGKEIGTVNTKPYFLNQVVKGQKFTKIVQKNTESAENRMLRVDVAEIYIPLMNQGNFRGALEIYYDISDRKRSLDLLVSKTLHTIYAFSIVFILSTFFVLNKSSIQIIQRKKAERMLIETNNNLETRVKIQTEEIRETQKISVKALATLAEYYDEDTGLHLARIQGYTELLCKWLSTNSPYSEYLCERSTYLEDIKIACLLHDVGKIAVSTDILTKPGKLTPEEFEIIKSHTSIAGQALTTANEDFRKKYNIDSYLALARDIAMYHHEKWNGKGYPAGFSGETIPLSARIVAVADVYDALISARPYKTPWPHEKAVSEIVSGSGEHFDPIVVQAFINLSDQFHTISKGGLTDTPYDE